MFQLKICSFRLGRHGLLGFRFFLLELFIFLFSMSIAIAVYFCNLFDLHRFRCWFLIYMHHFWWPETVKICGGSKSVGADIFRIEQIVDLQILGQFVSQILSKSREQVCPKAM